MSTTSPPWEPLPGEPSRWYDRFDCYRRLGPERTIVAAYRACTGRTGANARPAPAWYAAAATWRWEARAHAWDIHLRTHLRDQELAAVGDAQQQRLTRLELLLDRFEAGFQELLAVADAPALRRLLPQVRRDLAEVIRLERAAAGQMHLPAQRSERGAARLTAAERHALRELLHKLEPNPGDSAESPPE
jgi:hypothetical protein